MLGRRWADAPRGARLIVAIGVVVLGYGGVVHLVQLIGADLRPYPWAPTWLAVYFTALTLADPLAAVLLWARRRAGLYLGVLVLVTDAVANGYATYGLGVGATAARAAHVVVSLLAGAALATAPRVHRWLR